MKPELRWAAPALTMVIALGLAASPAALANQSDVSAVKVAPVFDHALPNVSGKSLIAVEVNYAPGEKSLPHRHEPSAFIMAYVVQGAIRSQVEGEPVKVYQAGQTWYENPGAHHIVSENASETEPAKLLAVFVVDTNHGELATNDKK